MKEVILEQAEEFYRYKLFSGSQRQTLELIRDQIGTELYNFYNERDKLIFLKSLKPYVIQEKVDHEEKCDKVNCGESKKFKRTIFIIDQEIETIENDFNYQERYNADSKFSPEEESDLNGRLSKIEEMLVSHGLGQEIIFDEINDLKLNFDLGKKSWFQLLKGKFFEMGAEEILDKTIIQESWQILREGFEVSKYIR